MNQREPADPRHHPVLQEAGLAGIAARLPISADLFRICLRGDREVRYYQGWPVGDVAHTSLQSAVQGWLGSGSMSRKVPAAHTCTLPVNHYASGFWDFRIVAECLSTLVAVIRVPPGTSR
jgi:hypothetical protein